MICSHWWWLRPASWVTSKTHKKIMAGVGEIGVAFNDTTKKRIKNASRNENGEFACFYCRTPCRKQDLRADHVMPQNPPHPDPGEVAREQKWKKICYIGVYTLKYSYSVFSVSRTKKDGLTERSLGHNWRKEIEAMERQPAMQMWMTAIEEKATKMLEFVK